MEKHWNGFTFAQSNEEKKPKWNMFLLLNTLVLLDCTRWILLIISMDICSNAWNKKHQWLKEPANLFKRVKDLI